VYRFLLTRSWLGGFALCVALAVLFVNLGSWQLDRLHQRRAINANVVAARSAPPRPVDAVLSTSAAPPRRVEYLSIQANGRYEARDQLLVRNRTVAGRASLLVLTPLVTDGGAVVLVVRGAVPASARGADAAVDVPPPPQGEVRVVGRVRLPEPGGAAPVEVAGQRQVTRIDAARLAAEAGRPTYRAYVELESQTPPGDDDLVAVPPPNALDEGPHLSYAVQWFLFAGLVFVGYGVLARTRTRRPEEPVTGVPAGAGATRPPEPGADPSRAATPGADGVGAATSSR
jgi:cytochrome oxidase assembly protein ShyY1